METAAYYQLSGERAATIAAEVRAAVERWTTVARESGARGPEIDRMQAVIDPNR